MESIKENQHAYVLEGQIETVVSELKDFLEKEWGMNLKGNMNVRENYYETLNIEDARKIKEAAITRPTSDKNIFIIATNFIGQEAQNALLKLLEEPIADTYFFILIPNANSLLGTVRSRAITLSLHTNTATELTDAKKFLKSNPEARLKILSSFLSHESETKKSDLIHFLNQLEREIATQKRTKETYESLAQIINFKKYLFDRSPSVKMIGEYLALRLP